MVLKKILYWLMVVCFPLLIVTSTIRVVLNSTQVYEYCIQKFDITSVTGIDNQELHRIYQHWLNYYSSAVTSPQVQVVKKGGEIIDLLSQKEIIHLQDVKGLVQLNSAVQTTVLMFVLVCIGILKCRGKEWRLMIKAIFTGSLITMGIVLLLAVASFLGFDKLFTLFHQVSFSNQFWILDPTKDYLIMMFPEGFFFDVALFGLGMAALLSTIFATLSYAGLRWTRDTV